MPRIVAVHATPVWLPRTQVWLYDQARFLPSSIETHIVCEKTANISEFALPNIHAFEGSFRVIRLIDRAARRVGIRRNLGFLTRVSADIGAGLIHSHFGVEGTRNIGAAREAGVRHAVTFYGADATQAPRTQPAIRERYLELFESVDRVFCEGQAMAASLVNLGCSRDRIAVHRLGVDLEALPFRPRRWAKGTPLRVLIAATFRQKKGIPDAMKALGRIRTMTPIEVTLVGDSAGKPGDLEEKSRILAAVESAGLTSQTRALGFLSHAELLREASEHHVFLAPSLTADDGDAEGGVPVSLIEMAASGMAVVSTRHCDIPEAIIDGKTGWLAPERDPEALAAHLEWLIYHPDDWLPFQLAGRAHIETEYSAQTQGVRLAEHYAAIAQSKPSP